MAYGKDWAIGPFTKVEQPVLTPKPDSTFTCPVSGEIEQWEISNVFAPAAVVKDDAVHYFYRADGPAKQDSDGREFHTCRIGLASSTDGLHFTRRSEPVLSPENDFLKKYTWDRGLWDPHITEDENGTYFLQYNTDNGKTHRRCVATSKDLVNWEKHGSIFRKSRGDDYYAINGLVIWRQDKHRKIAARINGKYWMYYDHHARIAVSDNLIDWEPLDKQIWAPDYRAGYFDSASGEPGTAMITDDGILFIYNAQNHPERGDPEAKGRWVWTLGQALIDPQDPTRLLDRLDKPFLFADRKWEIEGLTPYTTVMHDGMVFFKDRWHLYYGAADHVVALATCDVEIF